MIPVLHYRCRMLETTFLAATLSWRRYTSCSPAVSVCYESGSIETVERIELSFLPGGGLPFTYTTLCQKKIHVYPTTLPQTPDLENFASAYGSTVETCRLLSSTR